MSGDSSLDLEWVVKELQKCFLTCAPVPLAVSSCHKACTAKYEHVFDRLGETKQGERRPKWGRGGDLCLSFYALNPSRTARYITLRSIVVKQSTAWSITRALVIGLLPLEYLADGTSAVFYMSMGPANFVCERRTFVFQVPQREKQSSVFRSSPHGSRSSYRTLISRCLTHTGTGRVVGRKQEENCGR